MQLGMCLCHCTTGTWTLQSGAPTNILTRDLEGSADYLSTKSGTLLKGQSEENTLHYALFGKIQKSISFEIGDY